MALYEDCVCLAQARLIEGKRKKAHVCTIALHRPSGGFIRLCLPFNSSPESEIRRWDVFSFEGSPDEMDTRRESVGLQVFLGKHGQATNGERKDIHKHILSTYKYEQELNEERQSVGILLFDKDTVSFEEGPLSSREEEYRLIMQDKGLFFPNYKLYMTAKSEGYQSRHFRKQVLEWNFFEAIRKGLDPLAAFGQYKHPYAILGNTPYQRNGFMIVSFLSAPSGFMSYAYQQQLSLI